LKTTLILVFTVAMTAAALDLDIAANTGLSYPTGKWGNSLNTGLDGGVYASWIATPSLRAGLGVSFGVFGSGDQGAASLTMVRPQVRAGYYFRPWGRVFNPGLLCSFGMCRSALSNSGGTDPVTWDPFWSVGFRWNFSIGGGFRGEVGTDYSSIMAELQTGDAFLLQLGLSREVAI